MLDVAAFPVEQGRVASVANLVERLESLISEASGLSPQLFLQVAQLHVEEGSSRFAENASQWSPTLGLGVFPGREPPRTWTREDFESLEPGKSLRPTCHKVFHLGVSGQDQQRAWRTMVGRGATLHIFSSSPVSTMWERTRTVFLPDIKEKVFRRYPFFVPLFDRKVLEQAAEDQMARWSCGLSAYVRESAEDHAVLFASKFPIKKLIESLGPLAVR